MAYKKLPRREGFSGLPLLVVLIPLCIMTIQFFIKKLFFMIYICLEFIKKLF
jgi:hypothetical protein